MKQQDSMDVSRLNITSRLLAEEALRKGYSLEFFPAKPSSNSYTIRGVKQGKEVYFNSLNTLLTSAIGVFAAEDKVQTMSLLESFGVPMPETVVVSGGSVTQAAKDLLSKYSKVVVKPVQTNHGTGVTMGVASQSDMLQAVRFAQKQAGNQPDVLVQQTVEGKEYRFLVLEGKVIAVAFRHPPTITGDGMSTIAALVNEKNKDPNRGSGHLSALTKISIDDIIAHNPPGFLDTVPREGERIEVMKTSNLSKGGEAVDVTEEASDAIKDMAVRASEACLLGIAGVDIITKDISGDGTDSYVLEVNVSPGIRMHEFPSVGRPRAVSKQLFRAIEKTARPIGKKRKVVGRVEEIKLPSLVDGRVRARIDTGATMSSLWVSDIAVDENGLHCKLFGPSHPLFSGAEIVFHEYSMRSVRSSMGHEEWRYQVMTPVVIKGKKVSARVTLADRSSQLYPMLVGRNILRNKFVVDVASGRVDRPAEKSRIQNVAMRKELE